MGRRIPVLETERLIIRELTMDDLESINNVLNRSFGMDVSIEDRKYLLRVNCHIQIPVLEILRSLFKEIIHLTLMVFNRLFLIKLF